MAYKVIILYRLYMPSYFLGTFTEYPYIFFYGENKKGYVIKTYPFLYLNRGLIKLSSP